MGDPTQCTCLFARARDGWCEHHRIGFIAGVLAHGRALCAFTNPSTNSYRRLRQDEEESTVLGVPCLTMRPNTERPTTVTVGTSTLIGSDFALLRSEFQKVLSGQYKQGRVPDFWDGHTAGRVLAALRSRHGLPPRA